MDFDKPGGHNPAQNRSKRHKKIFFFTLLVLNGALLYLVYAVTKRSVLGQHAGNSPEINRGHIPSGKRNVIMMVSDGMGPASVALARNFFEHSLHGENDNNSRRNGHISDLSTLAIDQYFIGNSRTQSSDSYVTDSAAGATAFSCGLKTYNGAIGVDPDAKPCATVMEAAKLMGYRTGLVVTTRVTDATPASFASHAHDRSEEDFIAEQLLNHDGAHPFGSMVDLILGGGKCHFLPQGTRGSCRRDEKDLITAAKTNGWTYIDDLGSLRSLDLGHKNESLPLLGLFANHDLPFAIDYHDQQLPRLNETALTAIHALEAATKNSEQGFFLMVEGSRIDHAGHANDPAAQVHEVMAYSEVLDAIMHYAENEADVPTIVVSTSDHETGGLSVSRQISPNYPDYLWKPEILARAQHSAEYLSQLLRHYSKHAEHSEQEIAEFVKNKIVGELGLGIADATDAELAEIAGSADHAHDLLTKLINVRAQVGWSTHGHSGVDVNVYGASNYPQALDSIRGANENVDIGKFLQNCMHIKDKKLAELTKSLREKFGTKF